MGSYECAGSCPKLMGWFRNQIIKIVIRAIREEGLEIGEYKVFERNGALTITKRV